MKKKYRFNIIPLVKILNKFYGKSGDFRSTVI